jgi:hypothetical protein
VHHNPLRALPQVLAKGPVKAYKGIVHKTTAPPTVLQIGLKARAFNKNPKALQMRLSEHSHKSLPKAL